MYGAESTFEKNRRKEKGFSCRKRLIDIFKANNVPGPGNYETNSDISFRSIESSKIPQAERNTLCHITASN